MTLASKDFLINAPLSDVPATWLFEDYGALLDTAELYDLFVPNSFCTTHSTVSSVERASQVTSRKSGSSRLIGPQSNSAFKPEWIEQATYNRSALHFVSARNDRMAMAALPAGNVTVWGVVKVPPILASGQHYLWATANSGNRWSIRASGPNLAHQSLTSHWGASGSTHEIALARPYSSYFVFEASYDLVGSEHAFAINFGDFDAEDDDGNPTNKISEALPALTSGNNLLGNLFGSADGDTATAADADVGLLAVWQISRNAGVYAARRDVFRKLVNKKWKLGV